MQTQVVFFKKRILNFMQKLNDLNDLDLNDPK